MVKISTQNLREELVKEGLIDEKTFDELAAEGERLGQNVADILVSRGIISQEFLMSVLARYFGVPRADLFAREIDSEALHLIDEEVARKRNAIAFQKEADGSIDVAMVDPSDLETIEYLSRNLHVKVNPYFATVGELQKGFALYGAQYTQDFKKLIEDSIRESLTSRAKGEEEAAKEIPVIRIVDNILAYAVALRATDIHIETLEDTILVRYRIDGILREILRMPKEVYPAIVARIKLVAGLKIDEHMRPQDGRLREKIGNDFIDVRVSLIATFYGEKIQMRLLASTQKPYSLEELGVFPDMQKIIMENIKKTFGMFLVTGPTGAGKTTTLYSVLGLLNKPTVNIVTVEDPIEYEIKYVNQTQINPQAGVTFASGLRAILRQDPNIIMVGEIRDQETAEMSVNAALTGHLVLSSLHTNDAPTAIPRLVDLKIQPFLVAATLNVIIAQRLVRSVCKVCIYSYTPSPEITNFFKRELVTEGGEQAHIPTTLYRGKGCAQCGGSGYFGRIGIFEVLNVNEKIRALAVSEDFSLDRLREEAKKQGMISMIQDGLRKVEIGMTTIEEVLRVIRE